MSVQDMTLRYFVLLISVYDKFAKEEVYMRHLFLALLCVIMIVNTYPLAILCTQKLLRCSRHRFMLWSDYEEKNCLLCGAFLISDLRRNMVVVGSA